MDADKFNSYKKGSIQVLIDYLTFMMVFIMFAMPFSHFLGLFGLAVFTLLFVVLYSNMETFGERDRRVFDNNSAHPLKGVLMGLIAIIPIIIIALGFYITGDPHKYYPKEVLLNAIMSPFYIFFKLGHETLPARLLSTLTVPFIAGLGYFAGYNNFIIENVIRKAFGIKPRVNKKKLR